VGKIHAYGSVSALRVTLVMVRTPFIKHQAIEEMRKGH
jgi:hypothetical protein